MEHRKIIHIDMDAFYASIEQRDNPDYRGKPIAVGGSEKRGVVAAASYEARKFGVRSAMPSVTAKRQCPGLIFVYPDFEKYKSVSKQIMAVFRDYTDLVEPLSLDEAYLDVTENKKGLLSATLIAKEVKERIKKELNLTASAGVSVNKFLAKVASDMDKPDGLYVIPPDQTEKFIDKLEINRVPGIGRVTAAKMNKMNIHLCSDLKKFSRVKLINLFGKPGGYYFDIVHGDYDSRVKPDRIRKSVGAENTFREDLTTDEEMLGEIEHIVKSVAKRLERVNSRGKTVTLKIKYHDFESKTRSKTVEHYIGTEGEVYAVAYELFYAPERPVKPVRLLGVSVSNLNIDPAREGSPQLTLNF
jgi:DNA polymerase-4